MVGHGPILKKGSLGRLQGGTQSNSKGTRKKKGTLKEPFGWDSMMGESCQGLGPDFLGPHIPATILKAAILPCSWDFECGSGGGPAQNWAFSDPVTHFQWELENPTLNEN